MFTELKQRYNLRLFKLAVKNGNAKKAQKYHAKLVEAKVDPCIIGSAMITHSFTVFEVVYNAINCTDYMTFFAKNITGDHQMLRFVAGHLSLAQLKTLIADEYHARVAYLIKYCNQDFLKDAEIMQFCMSRDVVMEAICERGCANIFATLPTRWKRGELPNFVKKFAGQFNDKFAVRIAEFDDQIYTSQQVAELIEKVCPIPSPRGVELACRYGNEICYENVICSRAYGTYRIMRTENDESKIIEYYFENGGCKGFYDMEFLDRFGEEQLTLKCVKIIDSNSTIMEMIKAQKIEGANKSPYPERYKMSLSNETFSHLMENDMPLLLKCHLEYRLLSWRQVNILSEKYLRDADCGIVCDVCSLNATQTPGNMYMTPCGHRYCDDCRVRYSYSMDCECFSCSQPFCDRRRSAHATQMEDCIVRKPRYEAPIYRNSDCQRVFPSIRLDVQEPIIV